MKMGKQHYLHLPAGNSDAERENEWLPETTMSQCRATQRYWSPKAQPMSDLMWHGSYIHCTSEARDSCSARWFLWVH